MHAMNIISLELVLDIMGLCLCGLTAACLLKFKRRSVSSPPAGADGQGFSDILSREAGKGPGSREPCSFMATENFNRRSAGQSYGKESGCRTGAADLYEAARRMADGRTDIEDIVRQVGLPKREIALMLKLRNKTDARYHKNLQKLKTLSGCDIPG